MLTNVYQVICTEEGTKKGGYALRMRMENFSVEKFFKKSDALAACAVFNCTGFARNDLLDFSDRGVHEFGINILNLHGDRHCHDPWVVVKTTSVYNFSKDEKGRCIEFLSSESSSYTSGNLYENKEDAYKDPVWNEALSMLESDDGFVRKEDDSIVKYAKDRDDVRTEYYIARTFIAEDLEHYMDQVKISKGLNYNTSEKVLKKPE